MKKNNNEDFASELHAFSQLQEQAPPQQWGEELRAHVHGDLTVSLPRIFAKLLAIQVGLGLVTMIFCSQFGQGGVWLDLSSHFHHHHADYICALFCAGVFSFGTFFLGTLLLPWIEVQALRQRPWGVPLFLPTLLLGLFLLTGPEASITYIFCWAMSSFLIHLANLFLLSALRVKLGLIA